MIPVRDFVPDRFRPSAFTLIELMAVIAVVGLLAALIFPGVSAAQRAAAKARTRVQFNQWAAAIESFLAGLRLRAGA